MKKVKRYNGEDGSAVEMDEMEEANKSEEAMNIATSVGAGPKNTDIPKAIPKPTPKANKPKAAAKVEPAPSPKATPVDKTKMSVSERAKLSRESARSGSGSTDTRSVNQRLRSAFGMRKGGETKKMASGGMTSSASKRADGIAIKGKTKGRMC